MNSIIKVSIIIPVFNEEERIEKCLLSVMTQTLDQLEIIVVNDGSTDQTEKIVQKLSMNDSRIKLFNYENGGAAFAMSMGLKQAKGKYFIILDADDWVDKDMYEQMYHRIEQKNTDLVICNIVKHIDGIEKNTIEIDEDCIINENLLENYIRFKFDYSLCNKLYRKEIIDKFQITFNPNLRMGQDISFNLQVFSVIKDVYIIKNGLYHYVYKQGSMVASAPKDRIISYNLIIDTFKEYCIKNGFSKQWLIFEKNIGASYQSYFFNILLNSTYTSKMSFKEYYFYLLDSLQMLNKLLLRHCGKKKSIIGKFKNYLLNKRYFKVFSFIASVRHKII